MQDKTNKMSNTLMNEERTNDTEMKKVHRLGANEERAGTCFAKKENEEEEEEGNRR